MSSVEVVLSGSFGWARISIPQERGKGTFHHANALRSRLGPYADSLAVAMSNYIKPKHGGG